MNINNEIYKLLIQPENLAMAMEISDYLDEIKYQTHFDIWSGINPALKGFLVESNYAKNWQLRPFKIKSLKKEWGKGYIYPISSNQETPLLEFAFGQAGKTNSYRLFYGVVFTKDSQLKNDLISTRLKGEIISQGLTLTSPNWPGWNYLPQIPYTHEFIVGMTTHKDTYIQNAAKMIWDMFINLAPHLDAVNQSLISEN